MANGLTSMPYTSGTDKGRKQVGTTSMKTTAKGTEQKNGKTVVVFRKWRSGLCKGTIIALFPMESWNAMGSQCASYEHIGQHGPAVYKYVISETVPATPEEYRDLRRELVINYGYDFIVRKRCPSRRGV